MDSGREDFANNIEGLKAALVAERGERIIEAARAAHAEAELAVARAKATTVAAFARKRAARKPLPEHLPRERVIVPGPTTCLCCGGKRLRKLGETVTETLESVPRQWKVIQHVRMSARSSLAGTARRS